MIKGEESVEERIKTHLIHYCQSSDLHGFAYLTQGSSVRFIWTCALCFVLAMAGSFFASNFDMWSNAKTKIKVDNVQEPITNIQARICSQYVRCDSPAMRFLHVLAPSS